MFSFKTIFKITEKIGGCECGSMLEHSPSMCKAMGTILSTEKINKNKNIIGKILVLPLPLPWP
jgi:hypothetical protein